VSWHLTDCGEQAGLDDDRERAVPACVEASAVLPNDRKVVVQILVGAFKQGVLQLLDKTKFYFAVIEDGEQLHSVRKLGDLPQMVRMPFPRIRLRPVVLPNSRINRSPPQLYVATLPLLTAPPDTKPAGANAEAPPPPPRRVAEPRVSKGVSMGDAVTKVTPIYPAIAKQVNAYGEVQVEIEIDENGRVTEARAISGHPTLRGAAEDAAGKWVFKPTLLGGTPVRSKGTLIFVFTRPQ
jgi:TonB family protein